MGMESLIKARTAQGAMAGKGIKKKKRHTDLKKKKGDKVVINCGAAIT